MNDYPHQLATLSALLSTHRRLWDTAPFDSDDWRDQAPALWQEAQALSDDEVESLDRSNTLLWQWASQHAPELAPLAAVCQLPELPPMRAELAHSKRGIQPRKWAQIQAFAARLPDLSTPVIDWCAGKGHLAHCLGWHGAPMVTGLEWRADLCAQGNAFAAQQILPVTLSNTDVLDILPAALPANAQVTALHACGRLHIALLERLPQTSIRRLALSPCCYHAIDAEHYLPLSLAGRQHDLGLDQRALKLSIQETTIASPRRRQVRRTQRVWRLAFQALLEELTGAREYVRFPSLKGQRRLPDFDSFARQAASELGLVLPASIDSDRYLRRAAQRAQRSSRTELVRHVFRRPLEIWLLLDRACRLEEAGFVVTLGTFCARELTARNAVLLAERGPAVCKPSAR